jgi:hypothetical protein
LAEIPLMGKKLPNAAVYQMIKNGFSSRLQVTYDDPANTGNSLTVNISAAVSESPVPEPDSWMFLLTGVPTLAIRCMSGVNNQLDIKTGQDVGRLLRK